MKFHLKERVAMVAPQWVIPETVTIRRGRAECGNAACSMSWLAFLKDRRRPVFEGRWGCCARCLESLTEAAIRQEGGEVDAREEDLAYPHRMPLGLILLEQGWITAAQ